MARHHYVPQFLLRQWSSDGRLVAYFHDKGAAKVIENEKATVASACQIRDLSTFFAVPKAQKDFPETAHFTPRVDTPASRALQIMLDKGIDALTQPQRIDWARLLVSFAVRTPETLQFMGPDETKKAFDLVQATAREDPEDKRKVSAVIRQNMRTFKQNFPRQAAIDLSQDPKKLAAVDRMEWWIRRWTKDAILIGDRPLLASPRIDYPCGIPLNDLSCLIVLPLSPRAAFFASANSKTRAKVRSTALGRLARIVNEETIWRSTCVFARDASFRRFVTPRV